MLRLGISKTGKQHLRYDVTEVMITWSASLGTGPLPTTLGTMAVYFSETCMQTRRLQNLLNGGIYKLSTLASDAVTDPDKYV
jgi:hypothetical protein